MLPPLIRSSAWILIRGLADSGGSDSRRLIVRKQCIRKEIAPPPAEVTLRHVELKRTWETEAEAEADQVPRLSCPHLDSRPRSGARRRSRAHVCGVFLHNGGAMLRVCAHTRPPSGRSRRTRHRLQRGWRRCAFLPPRLASSLKRPRF